MVLFTLGILFISVLFLARRISTHQWRKLQYPVREADSAQPPTGESETRGSRDRKSMENIPPQDFKVSQESEDEAGSPTTPKANAMNGTAKGPVPTFSLESDEHVQNSKEDVKDSKKSTPMRRRSTSEALAPPGSMPPPPRRSQSPAKPTVPSSLMPPPSIKPSSLRPLPRLSNSSSLQPPPSAASSARGAPGRLSALSTSLSPNGATTSTLPPSKRSSRKVLLPPGHSPMDWAALTRSPPNAEFLRGKDLPSHLVKVSPSQLKSRNGRKGEDAWGTWQGKVYNLTAYKNFHPGGVGELMRGAGKLGETERLFMEVHPWVNWDGMLSECLVGIMVGEGEGWGEGAVNIKLDEMD